MGRLQLNERFTQIPNKLLEKLMTAKLTLYELRVTLAIIRKTLGFGKLMDRISEGQISLMTNINRKNVHTNERKILN